MKIISHSSAKKRTKMRKGFKFEHFYWLFSSDTMAVKGLKPRGQVKGRLLVEYCWRSGNQ